MKNSREIAIALANKLRQDSMLRQGSPVDTITKALSEAFAQGRVQGLEEATHVYVCEECSGIFVDHRRLEREGKKRMEERKKPLSVKLRALIDTRSQADEVDWSGRDVVDADGNPRLIQKNKLVGDE